MAQSLQAQSPQSPTYKMRGKTTSNGCCTVERERERAEKSRARAKAMGDQNREHPQFPLFPFKPYPIQIDFMSFLYESLNNGGISMLESPTGTGKTLSIICSSLQWILDRRRNNRHSPNPHSTPKDDQEPEWMRDFVAAEPKQQSKKREILTLKKKVEFGFGDSTIKKRSENVSDIVGENEDEFLVEDYESDEEGGAKRKCLGWSSSEEEEEEGVLEEEKREERLPKVFFASRTHSQLSQFVKEFRRTGFDSEMNVVCLGSRKNMCVNHDVLKLGSSSRINERCLELQKNRKDSKAKVYTNISAVYS